ncbi:MAG TPA: cytochrome c3 family protein, partial [Gemmataceae bacterium]|nr:cytochrome c3 family protein [Gemmataceae bacterium]
GCESCHGPGSLHSAAQGLKKGAAGEEDSTIVNPGRLPRDRLEPICAVCHLSGTAVVLVRGRHETDFRPGMPLTDYRIDYHLDSAGEQMTVVGHMQQLRLSPCYQKSEMSCLTCHDPHAREKPRDPVAFYRQQCLNCHESRGCSVPVADRRKKEPADNCSACHMPRGDTDIPHVAFTHHRIGKHSPRSLVPDRDGAPELFPAEDVSHFPPLERQRNLGIAYFRLSKSEVPGTTRYVALFSERAQKLLDGVYTAGLRDGMTVAALAESEWRSDPARAADYAREALTAPDLSAESRARALIVLADYHLREHDFPAAIGVLEQLVRMRRFTEDWQLLGAAYLSDRQSEKAANAFRQALAIRPTRPDLHRALTAAYFQLGDQVKAQEHRQKAEWLYRNRQD